MTPSQSPPQEVGRLEFAAVNSMFFCSGMASLMCQVVWFKQLGFLIGSSTFAVSVTVSAFFLGLALGSWSGGRLADQVCHPLRWYAGLELSLAAIVLGITWVLRAWETWARWLGPLLASDTYGRPLTAAVCFGVLLAPTLLMGATLPVMAKHLVRNRALLGRRIGMLYGINTAGAAVGCAAVGFFLMGLIGVSNTAAVAAGVYVAIAALAGILAWRDRSCPTAQSVSDDAIAAPAGNLAAAPVDGRGARTLVAVFALSGFASIAYEVLWFRMLTNFGISTVYAFSGMLATYLIGLVLGALFCALYLARQKELLLAHFARVQLATAVAGLISIAMLGKSPNILSFFAGVPGVSELDVFANSLAFMGLALVVLLVPTTVIGIGFPLASELTIERLGVLGKRLGLLYGLNTLGGVLGSLAAGFVLLPMLGSQWSLTAIAVLNLLLWGLVVASQPSLRGNGLLYREGALGIAVMVIGLVILGPSYLQRALTRFEGGELLSFHEAHDATFVVMGYDSPGDGRFQQLLVNGWSYANNSPPGRRYMATLAHLPTLLHRDPDSALLICVGTGTTIGSLTTYDQLKDIYAVDLSREPFRVAPYFVPINHRFWEQQRVRQVVDDGRRFLLYADRNFDVLTAEPPPPMHAGVVNLYSREFYQLAKQRMERGSVLAQWAPLDMPRPLLPRMLVKTMLDEFPHVSLWIPNRMEGVAIGSFEPLLIDVPLLRKRMSEADVQADLSAVGLGRTEQLLATFVAADAELVKWIGNVPDVTDDHPRLEYFNSYETGLISFDEIIAHREPVEKYLQGDVDTAALDRARAATNAIWYEHEATAAGRFDVARQSIDEGLAIEPENAYLLHLDRAYRQGQLQRSQRVGATQD